MATAFAFGYLARFAKKRLPLFHVERRNERFEERLNNVIGNMPQAAVPEKRVKKGNRRRGTLLVGLNRRSGRSWADGQNCPSTVGILGVDGAVCRGEH